MPGGCSITSAVFGRCLCTLQTTDVLTLYYVFSVLVLFEPIPVNVRSQHCTFYQARRIEARAEQPEQTAGGASHTYAAQVVLKIRGRFTGLCVEPGDRCRDVVHCEAHDDFARAQRRRMSRRNKHRVEVAGHLLRQDGAARFHVLHPPDRLGSSCNWRWLLVRDATLLSNNEDTLWRRMRRLFVNNPETLSIAAGVDIDPVVQFSLYSLTNPDNKLC